MQNTKTIAEYLTIKKLVTETHPKGVVSIVADSFDFFKVLTDIIPRLKGKIEKREGKVVIRPDSGDPYRIIVGYFDDEVYTRENGEIVVKETKKVITADEVAGSIVLLERAFGSTVNAKGFKELHPSIGLIYGDSITLTRCENILRGLKRKGFASTNVVFGVGSFTYQYQTRDTAGFAMKATAVTINGVERAIFKNPKTDGGTKKSAKGYLAVFKKADGTLALVDGVTRELSEQGELKEIFRNGNILRTSTLTEIRARINESLTTK